MNNIKWFNSKQEWLQAGLYSETYEKIKSNNEALGINAQNLHLLFSNKDHMESFLNAYGNFSQYQNKLILVPGLLNENSEAELQKLAIELNMPAVFFGTKSQQDILESAITRKKAFISSKCRNTNKTIAYQRHLCDDIHIQSVSLGEFRTDFGKAESILRGADTVFFELNALRFQDSYFEDSLVTGLDIYEASQLLRYTGMATSHKLLYMNVSHQALHPRTWESLATLMWYYLEGKSQMEIDSPEHEDNRKFFVETEFFGDALTFIQTHKTNRWWVVHPETKERIPCTEQDYISLRDGMVPDLLMDLATAE